MSSNWKPQDRILNLGFSGLLLAKSRDTNSPDCATQNEYIRIYGPELGSYCFSSNSDVGLVENAAENIQGKHSLPDSRCYKSRRVSMFIIFISL